MPRGTCPVIPYMSNARAPPRFFPKTLYRGRARIEQTVGKFKRFKRIALRCEKTARNFAAFVALALAFILVESTHTRPKVAYIDFPQKYQIASRKVQSALTVVLAGHLRLIVRASEVAFAH